MKNQQQIAMYIGLGALFTIVLLFLMGRIRTEGYEEDSQEELMKFLDEVEAEKSPTESPSATGPSAMGDDSDEE